MDAPLPVLEPVVPRRARRWPRLAAAIAVPVLAIPIYLAFRLVEPPAPVLPTRIALVAPDGSLSVLDEAGGSIASYDLPGVIFQFPAWSPDGSRVAAIGGDPASSAVYVLRGDGVVAGDPPVIYTSPDRRPFYLSWSPDGERITFLTNEPGGIALRIAPADGSAPAEIVRRGSPFYWDWVDPSRLLLHTGSSGPDAFVGEVDLEGTTVEGSSAEPGFFRAPGVSRTQTHRAYIAPAEGEGQAIVLEARDGSSRHDIAVEGNVAISFGPTASTLAFIASDRPTSEPPPLPIGSLRTVDAGTGAVRTLIDGPVLAFFWAPDGRTIAALEFTGPGTDVDQVRARGPRVARVDAAAVAPAAVAPAVAPPGLAVRLLFVDVETGATRSEREIRVTDLFAFQLLPFFDQYALSHRLWSPDSAAIVLPVAAEDGSEQLVILPADGADPRQLAPGSIAFWSP
jgi:TolB protein